MAKIKTPEEIQKLHAGGKILSRALREAMKSCVAGANTVDIDAVAREAIEKAGAKPSFLGYQISKTDPPFPSTLCISINDEVVHGIPSPKRVLKSGDVVGLDFGVVYDGYYGDAAMTVPVGRISPEVERLVKVTEQCLYKAIEQAVPGNYISDISAAVQQLAHANHYGIVRDFCGHGIGRSLHEDPPVLNYVQNGKGPRIKPGLVLAIEPMINLGTDKVKVLEDGWTVITADGKPSAHFEHTIAITPEGPVILTQV